MSCQRCRIRKEKCDRNRQGCENCKRHNVECLWLTNAAKSAGSTNSTGVANGDIHSLAQDLFTPKSSQSNITASTDLPPYTPTLDSCCQLADEICRRLPAKKQMSLLLARFQEVPMVIWNCIDPEELKQSFARDWDALHSKTRSHDKDHYSRCSISFDTVTQMLMTVAASAEMLPTTYLTAIGLVSDANKAHELIVSLIELYLASFQYCVDHGDTGIALLQVVFLFNVSLTDK